MDDCKLRGNVPHEHVDQHAQVLKELFLEHDWHYILVRASALDEWASLTEYHDNVHGGSIVADVNAIRSFSSNKSSFNKSRVEKWKVAFLHFYGVPFHIIENRVNHIPDPDS